MFDSTLILIQCWARINNATIGKVWCIYKEPDEDEFDFLERIGGVDAEDSGEFLQIKEDKPVEINPEAQGPCEHTSNEENGDENPEDDYTGNDQCPDDDRLDVETHIDRKSYFLSVVHRMKEIEKANMDIESTTETISRR